MDKRVMVLINTIEDINLEMEKLKMRKHYAEKELKEIENENK